VLDFGVLELAPLINLSFDPNIKIQDMTPRSVPEGSETGGVFYRRLSRRLQARVGP